MATALVLRVLERQVILCCQLENANGTDSYPQDYKSKQSLFLEIIISRRIVTHFHNQILRNSLMTQVVWISTTISIS